MNRRALGGPLFNHLICDGGLSQSRVPVKQASFTGIKASCEEILTGGAGGRLRDWGEKMRVMGVMFDARSRNGLVVEVFVILKELRVHLLASKVTTDRSADTCECYLKLGVRDLDRPEEMIEEVIDRISQVDAVTRVQRIESIFIDKLVI